VPGKVRQKVPQFLAGPLVLDVEVNGDQHPFQGRACQSRVNSLPVHQAEYGATCVGHLVSLRNGEEHLAPAHLPGPPLRPSHGDGWNWFSLGKFGDRPAIPGHGLLWYIAVQWVPRYEWLTTGNTVPDQSQERPGVVFDVGWVDEYQIHGVGLFRSPVAIRTAYFHRWDALELALKVAAHG